MTATEFERRLRQLASQDGMTFATFITLDEAVCAVRRASVFCRFDAGAA